MKMLIALAAIAAATYFPNQSAVKEGEKFEAPDDVVEKILADKVAELVPDAEGSGTAKTSAKTAKRIKVRLLVDSALGNTNDVVEVDADQVKQIEKDGIADSDKGAVAYALGLEQNKPQP
jgi:hypothetical protein